MGNTKKLRKKYETPSTLWDKERISEEKEYIREYGLKNKKEIWIMASLLSKFKNIAKEVISENTAQAEKEGNQLLNKLRALGLLNETSMLSDVLKLTTKDILERRLQTVVFRKGFAHSVNQARQLITHDHIIIGSSTISSPSYLVKKSQEEIIAYNPKSSFSDPDHPERNPEKASAPKKADKAEKNSEKDNKENSQNDAKKEDEKSKEQDKKDN